MKKIREWYENLSFRRRVFVSHLMVSLIPVIILGAFSYVQTRNLLIEREKRVIQETLRRSVGNLEADLTAYENVMNNLVWDTSLKEALRRQYTNNYEMFLAYRDVIDPSLFQMTSLNPKISGITIYSSNPSLYPHGMALRKISEYQDIPEAVQDYRMHWGMNKEGGVSLVCGVYSEHGTDKNIVSIRLNSDALFSWMTEVFAEDYGILLADETGETVFRYDTFQNQKILLPMPEHEKEKRLDIRYQEESNRRQYVLNGETVDLNGWTMYLYRPVQVVSSAAFRITFVILAVILLCMLIILAASATLTGTVVRPLKELISDIDRIEAGDLSVEARSGPADEIGLLMMRFGGMVKRLNYMINEVYKSQIAQQSYELKALQAQINPHFLYNSLSLINWKAIIAGQDEISEMTQLLSTFYRTTLNKGKNIILVSREWDNISSYARIQNLLHSGKLNIHMELQEDMKECRMLNLLLQPLVENAIVHGLDLKNGAEEKRLDIRGRREDGRLIFEVEDNGCGMSREVMEGILSASSKGYGVQNVHHRIQLYYGNGYGLSYQSTVGKGTCAVLTIPDHVKPEHEENDQKK